MALACLRCSLFDLFLGLVQLHAPRFLSSPQLSFFHAQTLSRFQRIRSVPVSRGRFVQCAFFPVQPLRVTSQVTFLISSRHSITTFHLRSQLRDQPCELILATPTLLAECSETVIAVIAELRTVLFH